MAEYYVVLKRAVSVIDPGAIDTRRAVYDKARSALVGQLKAIEPPLSTAEISRQRLDLEEAIRRVEREAMSAQYADSVPEVGRAQPQRGRSESVQRSVAEEVDLDLDLDLDADFDRGSEARRSQASRGRSEPREIFQRALKESEYESRPREGAARRPSEDVYEPPRRSAEPERRSQYARRDLANERPSAEFENDDRDSDFDDGQDDYPAEPQSERRPRAPRKGETSRAAPRMPERVGGGEDRPRRSMLPLVLTLLLLVVGFGGAAVFFYNVPEARKLVASVISNFDRQEKPAAVAQAPSTASGPSEKTAERLGAPSTVRAVDSSASAPASTTSPASTAPRPAAAPSVSPPQAAAPVIAAAPRPNIAPPQAAAASAPQKAMLYEESMAQDGQVAGAFEGNVVWQFVENGPDGPAVEGVVTVPDRKLRIQISIRRNGDARLPASHLVELAVNAPAEFGGGGVGSIPQLVLKAGESTPGQAMAGVPTKVVEGLFWIALSSDKKASGTNLSLMKANAFMDVPLLYKSGQRAILTLAKGETGGKAFERAFAAWGN